MVRLGLWIKIGVLVSASIMVSALGGCRSEVSETTASLLVDPRMVAEGGVVIATLQLDGALGRDGTFVLGLGNTAEDDDVDANVDGMDDNNDASFVGETGRLTIESGETEGIMMISIANDAEMEGDETFTVWLARVPRLADNLSRVVGTGDAITVTIAGGDIDPAPAPDPDSPGVTAMATDATTSEAGDTATIDVLLNTQPTADVTVTPTSSDTTEGRVSGALTFTSANWDTPQVVTVTGVDDTLSDGNQTYQIEFTVASADGDYSGLTVAPVEIINSDDDSPGVTAAATDATTSEAGDTATIDVRLNRQPMADVTITPTSSDTTEGRVSGALTFTTANWSTAQMITVTGVDDDIADGDQDYQIDFTLTSAGGDYDGGTVAPVEITNSDNDTLSIGIVDITYRLDEHEGTINMILDVDGVIVADAIVSLETNPLTAISDEDFVARTGGGAAFTIPAGDYADADTVEVPLEIIDDDRIEASQEQFRVRLTATDQRITLVFGKTAELIIIDDDDMATVSIEATIPTAVENGADGAFRVSVTGGTTTAAVVVPLNIGGDAVVGDYTLSVGSTALVVSAGSTSLTIPSGASSATITVAAEIDDDATDETLTLTIGEGITGGGRDGAVTRTTTVADQSATVTLQDNNSPGVTVMATDDTTSEAGDTATIRMTLANAPTADVTVTLVSSDTTEGRVSSPMSGTLTFTTGNWSTAQTITVTGVDDDLIDGDQVYQIRFTVASADSNYDGLTIAPVTITNSDDDSVGVTVMATDDTTSEAGDTATIRMTLANAPTADVTITPTSSDTTEGRVSAPLTFTTGNWSTAQTITVTGVDDDLIDGDQVYQIRFTVASADSNYDGLTIAPVTITNSDDDSVGVTVMAPDITTSEAGDTATIRMTLANAPTADVSITPTSSDTTEGRVSAPLTFTTGNWSTAQTITVTGVDDDLIDGDQVYQIRFTVASADSNYDGLTIAPVTIVNSDDDSVGVTVMAPDITTSEAGDTATIRMTLANAPTADVSITPTSSDTTEGRVSAPLTFTTGNWSTAQTITVTGVDDDLIDGDQMYQIRFTVASADSNYDGLTIAPVTIVNSDDDSVGVTVMAPDITTSEAGDTATIRMTLANAPTADVSITPTSSDTTEGRVSVPLTFTTGNWSTAQVITVTGVDDDLIDGDQVYQIRFMVASADSNYDGLTIAPVTIVNSDDDATGVTVMATDATTSEAGDTAEIRVALNSQPTATVTFTPVSDDTTEGTVSGVVTLTPGDWNTPQTITVTGVDDDVDDGHIVYRIEVTVASADSNYDGVGASTVVITNIDDDNAGVITNTVDPTTSEAGDTAEIRVALTSQPTATVTVTPTSSDTTEGTVSGALTFTTGNWSAEQTITVTGVDDDVDDGNIVYRIEVTVASADSNYDGVGASAVVITNIDDDNAGVITNTVDPTTSEAGDTAEIRVALTSQPTATVTVTPVSNDTTEGTVSGALTFTTGNWSAEQTITVTGVDDDVDDGDQPYQIRFMVTGSDLKYSGLTVAQVTIINSDDDMTGITVMATDTTTSEAGDTATIRMTLNSQPTSAATVTPTSSDTTEGRVSAPLTFTTSNWRTAQVITVTGVDDDVTDGDQMYQIRFTVASADSNYDGLTIAPVTITNSDDEIDYDVDDDGLIDIGALAQLDAIRYDPDGDGMPSSGNEAAYATPFPDAGSEMGCPTSGCTGYELVANLDFDTDGDGRTHTGGTGDAGDAYYNGGVGWTPIGIDLTNSFDATFEGGGHTISNLFIDRSTNAIGLFGDTASGSEIEKVGMVDVFVRGDEYVGGLVGRNDGGTLIANYVTGTVSGRQYVGGLVGLTSGSLITNYATATISGTTFIGGLVGWNRSSSGRTGHIIASYATGAVNSSGTFIGGLSGDNLGGMIITSYATGMVTGTVSVGGLVGNNSGGTSIIIDSYSDSDTTGQSQPVGNGRVSGAESKTTAELRTPTDYTGIYADWDNNSATGTDDFWDFGTTSQYPVLQVDFNNDGVATWEEFGVQR